MDVTLPDGTILQGVPEGTTKEEIAARLQGAHGTGQPQSSTAVHKAKLLGSDIVKGALGLPALAYDFARNATKGDLSQEELGPTFQTLTALQSLGESPTTDADKWQSAITQGAAGGVAGPGGLAAPLRSAVTGGGADFGSELAARLFGEGFLSRFLGGLAGGGGAGAVANRVGRASPQLTVLAREGLEGIPPGMLEKAAAFQAAAKAQGVDLDLVQALEGVGASPGNLATIRNVLAGNKSGNRVQQVNRDQPDQLEALADVTVAGMPGKVRQADVAANNLQEAATGRIQLAKDARTSLWETTLENVRNTLKDSAALKVREATQKLEGLNQTVAQARARLLVLENDLTKAQAGDAQAIAAANAKVAEAKRLVASLREFTLPRGKAAGNTGRYLDLPQRGHSIGADEITRDVTANRLEAGIPPIVPMAPSLQTSMAEKAVGQGRGQLNQAQMAADLGYGELQSARDGLQAVTRVPPETGAEVVKSLQRLASQYPNTAQGRAMLQLANNLRKGDGSPLTDPNQINQVLKEAAAKLKSPDLATQGVDAGTAKWIGLQIQEARDKYGKTFTPLRAANEAYSEFTKTEINPLKQGLVGDFATKKGYTPDVAAKQERLVALFDKGEDLKAGGKSNIYQFGQELAKVDPEAFADAFKTYLSQKVGKAFPPNLPGQASTTPTAPIRALSDSLFANRNQMNGLRQGAAVAAKSFGLPEADVVRGLENFAQITKALLNRPASIGGLSREEAFQLGGRNYGSDALRVFGIAPLAGPARKIEDVLMARTFREFDKLLTTPDGAAKLAELGRMPVMSDRAIMFFSTLGGTVPGVAAGSNAPGITTQ